MAPLKKKKPDVKMGNISIRQRGFVMQIKFPITKDPKKVAAQIMKLTNSIINTLGIQMEKKIND